MKEHTLLSDRLKSIFHRPVLSLASRFVFFHVEVSGGPGYSYFHTFLAFLAAPSSRSLLLFLFEYAPHIITSRKKTFTRIDIKIHCGFCVLRCAAARLGRGKVRCEDLFLNIARPENLNHPLCCSISFRFERHAAMSTRVRTAAEMSKTLFVILTVLVIRKFNQRHKFLHITIGDFPIVRVLFSFSPLAHSTPGLA